MEACGPGWATCSAYRRGIAAFGSPLAVRVRKLSGIFASVLGDAAGRSDAGTRASPRHRVAAPGHVRRTRPNVSARSLQFPPAASCPLAPARPAAPRHVPAHRPAKPTAATPAPAATPPPPPPPPPPPGDRDGKSGRGCADAPRAPTRTRLSLRLLRRRRRPRRETSSRADPEPSPPPPPAPLTAAPRGHSAGRTAAVLLRGTSTTRATGAARSSARARGPDRARHRRRARNRREHRA